MRDANEPARVLMAGGSSAKVDFIEAGTGPLVVLVHSSMAGARQWCALIRDLQDQFRVRAVNLFGYGGTPALPKGKPSSLADFAELVALAVPDSATDVSLVGHSIGGAVAMHAAALRLKSRVRKLVLFEPSLFGLLGRGGRTEALREIVTLAEFTRRHIRAENPAAAAERFIDYWCGLGSWAASSAERKFAFARLTAQLPQEWDAVLDGTMTPSEWAEALPRHTLVMTSATTTRPSRELVEILSRAGRAWGFASVRDGGHMAPVTNAGIVNSIVRSFLTDRAPANSD